MRSSSATKRSPREPTAQEARQHLGHLHAREPALARLGVAQHHAEREREVRDVRERPSGADRERRQDGEDRAVEHRRELAALGGGDRGHGQHGDVGLGELAQQPGDEAALALDELAHARPDAVEHLGGQQVAGGARAVGRRRARPRAARRRAPCRTRRGSRRRSRRSAGARAAACARRRPARARARPTRATRARGRRAATRSVALLRAAHGHQTPPAIIARARGRRNQRSSPRRPEIGSIAAAPALGNEMRAPVSAWTSSEKSGSWPTSTSSSPWRSVRPARSSSSTPEQRGVVGERGAELVRDDLGRLVCARVRARHHALRRDLERRQRPPRRACGARCPRPRACARDRACRARDPRPQRVGRG